MDASGDQFLEALLVDLDEVRLREVAEAALGVIIRQMGRQDVANRAAELVGLAVDGWDPTGPAFTDRFTRRAVKGVAQPAVRSIVYEILGRFYDA